MRLRQAVSTSAPSGVTSPNPVTTTRRMAFSVLLALDLYLKTKRPPAPVETLGRGADSIFVGALSGPGIARTATPARSALVLVDEGDRVLHGRDLLGGIIRNLDFKLFLEGHHQLDDVEAVGAQIIDEARVRRHLVFFDAQVLDNDLLNAVGGIAHVMPSRIGCDFAICPNERFARWQVPGAIARS